MLKQKAPNLRFDLRAKGLPDSVIQSALDTGVKFRITTKYWMEQMGLPFHPTHINTQNQLDRRHSYADLLRYPQRYTMHWRLWNGGTARVLLWGDPDYARRIAESTHLYDILPRWDLMYLLEVMDKEGNGAILPDLNRQTPYIVVRLAR